MYSLESGSLIKSISVILWNGHDALLLMLILSLYTDEKDRTHGHGDLPMGTIESVLSVPSTLAPWAAFLLHRERSAHKPCTCPELAVYVIGEMSQCPSVLLGPTSPTWHFEETCTVTPDPPSHGHGQVTWSSCNPVVCRDVLAPMHELGAQSQP